MRAKLSDRYLLNLKPPADEARLDVWDSLLPGFGVRVGTRKKTFVAMVRSGGVKRRVTLGDYPALPLAKAREKAREAMRIAERGEDPNRAVAQERAAKDTVEKLVADYIEKFCRRQNRDWRQQQSIFNVHVLPHWRHRHVGSITRRDCIELLDKAAERTSPVNANRVRAQVSRFFNWLIGRDVLEANPMQHVPRPGAEAARDRTLSGEELAQVWRACEGLGFPFGPMFRLLILTAQRRDEVGRMRWRDVDLDRGVWTVPAEVAKNGLANEVPLAPLAAEILKALPRFEGRDNPEGYVFPAATGSGKPASGYSKAKARLDAAIAKERAEAEEEPMAAWWLHDLRRTGASGMARLGIAPHVIEKVLNHVTGQLSGVAGIYNRHGYLPEKQHALETWASHVARLVEPEAVPSNVVELRAAG